MQVCSNRCPDTILGGEFEVSQELRLDNQPLETRCCLCGGPRRDCAVWGVVRGKSAHWPAPAARLTASRAAPDKAPFAPCALSSPSLCSFLHFSTVKYLVMKLFLQTASQNSRSRPCSHSKAELQSGVRRSQARSSDLGSLQS